MRGKTVDVGFLSSFVESCVISNKVTPKEIANEAKEQISKIDLEIRRIEKLKLERSKLIDVINSFDSEKNSNESDIKNIFNQVSTNTLVDSNLLNDNFILNIYKYFEENESLSIKQLLFKFNNFPKEQIFFALKKLSANEFIVRNVDKNFIKGPKWTNNIESFNENSR